MLPSNERSEHAGSTLQPGPSKTPPELELELDPSRPLLDELDASPDELSAEVVLEFPVEASFPDVVEGDPAGSSIAGSRQPDARANRKIGDVLTVHLHRCLRPPARWVHLQAR